MNISFGKNIPFIQTKIKNKKSSQYEKATVYEIDCKDLSDINEICSLNGKWQYKDTIEFYMRKKHNQIESGYSLALYKNSDRFFSIKQGKNSILGICQIHDDDGYSIIDFIEARNGNTFRYIGQNLIAAIGLDAIKNNKKGVIVTLSTEEALPFYINKCGFKPSNNRLILTNDKIQALVENLQNKTSNKIINLTA